MSRAQADHAAPSTACDTPSAVAIIGMAGKFAGAGSVDELWASLAEGRSCITMRAQTGPAADDPLNVGAHGTLTDVHFFDAAFFGINPRDAEIIDPQQRLLLETAWTALEDAGYDPSRCPGRVGVFVSCSISSYLLHQLLQDADLVDRIGWGRLCLGNDKDHAATRISYKLDLHGPSMTVQTACSSSLVAVHLACQSLRAGECDMALAGGASIAFPQHVGYRYEEGGIVSPDGRCRAYDADASGTVPGDGVAVVVLRPVAEVAPGDTIRALIRGSAVNNDGSRKLGYVAPSVEAQSEVILAALHAAGVTADEISFIEGHGTGTRLGDPVEVAALTDAFGTSSAAAESCALGSIKASVGHLDAAAGVAGLVKGVLALENQTFPGTMNFVEPNPELVLEKSPFFVTDDPVRLHRGSHPLRGAVSALGAGGTNAHVILEEAPESAKRTEGNRTHLLLLSARTRSTLERYAAAWAEHLVGDDVDLPACAYTTQIGRHAFRHRLFVECDAATTAADAVRRACRPPEASATAPEEPPSVAFLFPGQGSQFAGMGAAPYRAFSRFREAVDDLLPRSSAGHAALRRLILDGDYKRSAVQWALSETELTQPALLAVELGIAAVWSERGVRPVAMLGHSLGEYVAATLAGVMTPADAFEIVCMRGRLMQSCQRGAMLAVELSEDASLEYVGNDVALAAVNGPHRCTLSGKVSAIDAVASSLERRDVRTRRLSTSHAFHSPLVDAAAAKFEAFLQGFELSPPRDPVISNVTGNWLTAAQATDPRYWSSQLRQTVRFADGLATLAAAGYAVAVESGPGQSLAALVAAAGVPLRVVPSLLRADGMYDEMLGATGRLWLSGVDINWEALWPDGGRRCRCPTYPFERVAYMLGEPEASAVVGGISKEAGRAETGRPPLDPGDEIRTIWGEVLGLDGISNDDDFFDLGGDSLLALRVAAQVEERLALQVNPRTFFDSSTFEGFCRVVLTESDFRTSNAVD